MRDSPKVVYRGNAKKNWNNNSSFKTSGDLPYENNGENVHPNNQPQNPSQNITNDPDEDDDNSNWKIYRKSDFLMTLKIENHFKISFGLIVKKKY